MFREMITNRHFQRLSLISYSASDCPANKYAPYTSRDESENYGSENRAGRSVSDTRASW